MIHVVSAPCEGPCRGDRFDGSFPWRWRSETTIALGTDVREPFLVSFHGKLILHFFQAGTNPASFDPQRLLRVIRLGDQAWSEPEEWGPRGDVAWEFKVRKGEVWMSSYHGNHYKSGPSNVELKFSRSQDGLNWLPASDSNEPLYSSSRTTGAYGPSLATRTVTPRDSDLKSRFPNRTGSDDGPSRK